MRSRCLTALLSLIVQACQSPPSRTRADLVCRPPTTAHWLVDSTAALCLPADFVSRGPHRFARPRGDTLPEHWLSVYVQHGPPALGEPWPITLASGPQCFADCSTAEDIVTSRDSVAGVAAYVERGLISGGISGEHRRPALVASLDGRPDWTAVVWVYTPDVALRDSLANALATLRLYPAALRDH